MAWRCLKERGDGWLWSKVLICFLWMNLPPLTIPDATGFCTENPTRSPSSISKSRLFCPCGLTTRSCASYGEVSFHDFDQSVNSFWMKMRRKIFLLFSIAHTSHNFSSRAFFLSSPLFLIRQAGGFTKCGHEPLVTLFTTALGASSIYSRCFLSLLTVD